MDRLKHNQTDILVIGAGPAGTVAASILCDKGYDVTMVEKSHFPRFVIGESLLPRCMESLEKAGFIPSLKKAGFIKKVGAQFDHDGQVCEFNFNEQFSEGWTWTWQVQRGPFDKVLADEVAHKGATVLYGASVEEVKFHDDGSSVSVICDENSHKTQLSAKYIVDASGYGRVLPRLLDLDRPSSFPSRTALFCHVKPDVLPQGKERQQIIIVTVKKAVWAWIIPFADGTYSIGVVGDDNELNSIDGDLSQQMKHWIAEVPALASRFSSSEMLFEPKKMTGYSKSVSRLYGKNYVLTGNSSEFVDPIFSSGVTFAVESSARAAELIDESLKGGQPDWENDYATYLTKGVDVFKTFIQAWYDGTLQTIFFSDRPNDTIRKQICSILAGYVWDENNPYVRKHARAIPALAAVLNLK